MPVGLGIMQHGSISIYDTTTIISSVEPLSGDGYCDDSFTFVIHVQNNTLSRTSTTIASGSDGYLLPTGTIFVASTTGFPPAGQIFIRTINTIVSYTNTTSNSFTGCTGGTGSLRAGLAVSSQPFPPRGSVYLQDLVTGIIPAGGTGILTPLTSSISSVNISPTLSVGEYNFVAFYIGQEGNSYILSQQFKPSQSLPLDYLVNLVFTSTTITGPTSYQANTSTNYTITVSANPNSPTVPPSLGTISLSGIQGTNPSVLIGSATPTSGVAVINIPANKFVGGTPVLLTASFVDPGNCYVYSSGNKVVNPLG